MGKYTFIIPVYNVEDFLRECVDSILCQTYLDYEIILVDDGSTDQSGAICDSYAAQYDKITVIHQNNAGPSEARNTGVKAATTDYIIFLDSDDYWYDKQGLEKIDRLLAPNVDVVFFASKNLDQRTGILTDDRYSYPKEMNELAPEDCLAHMICSDRFNLSAAKKVYSRSFFVNSQLFFTPGIKSEDIEQGLRMANCLPNCRFLDEKLYVYRHRANSRSTTVGAKHLEDYLYIIKKYANFPYHNEHVRQLLLSYLGYQYALLLAYATIRRTGNNKRILKELKPYSDLLTYPGYPRTEMICRLYRILGFRLTGIALGVYLKRK